MYFPEAICFNNCCHLKLSLVAIPRGTAGIYTQVKMLHFSTCTKKYWKWPWKGIKHLALAQTDLEQSLECCPELVPKQQSVSVQANRGIRGEGQ